MREVFPGSGRVLGIQVDNNYINLPGVLFENLNESGICTSSWNYFSTISLSVFVASFYFTNITHALFGFE